MKRTMKTMLALMAGFCFSVNMFANVEGDDPQKKKYAN